MPQYDELVQDGENGRRVESDSGSLAQALIAVLEDELFRRRCRDDNRRIMERIGDQDRRCRPCSRSMSNSPKPSRRGREEPEACAMAGLLVPSGDARSPRILEDDVEHHRPIVGRTAGVYPPRSGCRGAAVTCSSHEQLSAMTGRFAQQLAHRRLAIIDLSEAGHQPMAERGWA
ncbi:MAG: hypothetical protein U0231_00670 [Nitrospiraceae bacterium]